MLKVKGPLDIEQAGLAQDYDGSVVLPASEARLHGERHQIRNRRPARQPRFLDQPRRLGRLGPSRSPGPASSKSPPKSPPSNKASLEVSVGDSKTSGAATATGDYGKFKVAKLGTLEIASPGKVTLAVRPVKDGWHPLNLKAIRLRPAAAAQ